MNVSKKQMGGQALNVRSMTGKLLSMTIGFWMAMILPKCSSFAPTSSCCQSFLRRSYVSRIGRLATEGDDNRPEALPEELMAELNKRISEQRSRATEKEERIRRNWTTGNWSVRGFLLDKQDAKEVVSQYQTDGSSIPPIHVCSMSSGPDIDYGIAVGRTNGSVCIMRLGGEYIAKFASRAKLTLVEKPRDLGNGFAESDVTVPIPKLTSELVRAETLEKEKGGGNSNTSGDSSEDAQASDATESSSTILPTQPQPFEILLQFDAHESDINSILYDSSNVMFTASDNEFKEWNFPRTIYSTGHRKKDQTHDVQCTRTYSHHTDKVVALDSLYSHALKTELVLSFSLDGSFCIWDREKGVLLTQIFVSVDESRFTSPILSAAIEEDEGLIFVGTSSGHVLVYDLDDISLAKDSQTPQPKCIFLAYTDEQGVSAMFVTSDKNKIEESNKPNMKGMYTCSLYTGSKIGHVKKWNVMGRLDIDHETKRRKPFSRLEYWPRMKTQRLKDSAHIFEGHSGEITKIIRSEANVISASRDGSIRIWSPSSGDELYFMDGFENVSSLCCEGSLLITDGMKNYVCVHDFDTVEDIDETIDLDFGT